MVREFSDEMARTWDFFHDWIANKAYWETKKYLVVSGKDTIASLS